MSRGSRTASSSVASGRCGRSARSSALSQNGSQSITWPSLDAARRQRLAPLRDELRRVVALSERGDRRVLLQWISRWSRPEAIAAECRDARREQPTDPLHARAGRAEQQGHARRASDWPRPAPASRCAGSPASATAALRDTTSACSALQVATASAAWPALSCAIASQPRNMRWTVGSPARASSSRHRATAAGGSRCEQLVQDTRLGGTCGPVPVRGCDAPSRRRRRRHRSSSAGPCALPARRSSRAWPRASGRRRPAPRRRRSVRSPGGPATGRRCAAWSPAPLRAWRARRPHRPARCQACRITAEDAPVARLQRQRIAQVPQCTLRLACGQFQLAGDAVQARGGVVGIGQQRFDLRRRVGRTALLHASGRRSVRAGSSPRARSRARAERLLGEGEMALLPCRRTRARSPGADRPAHPAGRWRGWPARAAASPRCSATVPSIAASCGCDGHDAAGKPAQALGFVQIAAAQRQLRLQQVGAEQVRIQADAAGQRSAAPRRARRRRAAGRRARNGRRRRPAPARCARSMLASACGTSPVACCDERQQRAARRRRRDARRPRPGPPTSASAGAPRRSASRMESCSSDMGSAGMGEPAIVSVARDARRRASPPWLPGAAATHASAKPSRRALRRKPQWPPWRGDLQVRGWRQAQGPELGDRDDRVVGRHQDVGRHLQPGQALAGDRIAVEVGVQAAEIGVPLAPATRSARACAGSSVRSSKSCCCGNSARLRSSDSRHLCSK